MPFTTLVTPADVAPRIGDAALVMVDVRHDLAAPDTWGAQQYRAGHLPGAVFAALDSDLSGPKTGRNGRHPLPTAEVAASFFGRLGLDESKQVIVYDQNTGMFASRLWWMLRWLGHDAVAVLEGGFERWHRAGLPVESGWHSAAPAHFKARQASSVIDAARLERNLSSNDLLVIDARAPERYRGDVEPLDSAAGHIPGAINRPYADNLAADGRFKPVAVLRAEYERLLAGHAAASTVHQCGSGVSACHNLLAMVHAGMPGGSLYPGSWSEWSADPSRPLHRGGMP